ncbi:MAG: hypothetical protein AB7N73_14920 [Gemmatimonadales bacterium]
MSPRERPLGALWKPYAKGAGLGFSFKEPGTRGLRADMAPAINADGLLEWRAELWRGDERGKVLREVWGMTHWHCAAAVEAAARELEE